MKKLKTFIVILITILIIIVAVIVLLKHQVLKKSEDKVNNNVQVEEELNIMQVNNASMFFTVENCINKYLSYLYSQNTEVIFNLLEEGYKTKFGINKTNVLQYVEQLDGSYVFTAEDMYYPKNGDIQTYYVTGKISEDGLIENSFNNEYIEFNTTVIMDMENSTFTIIPYGYGGMYYEEKGN